MATITRVRVSGLHGRFNHVVDFPGYDSFVILHGPNGIGKTHVLRIVHAIISGEYWRLRKIVFKSVHLEFEDFTEISVIRGQLYQSEKRSTQFHYRMGTSEHVSPADRVTVDFDVQIRRLGQRAEKFTVSLDHPARKLSQRLQRNLERELNLELIGDDWYDASSERIISTPEAISRYAATKPGRAQMMMAAFYGLPEAYQDLIASSPVRLIETQRLVAEGNGYSATASPFSPRSTIQSTTRFTAVEFSEDIQRKIKETLAENSRISQRLDRTFPIRVLRRDDDPTLSTRQLVAKHNEQAKLRNRLAKFSLSESSNADNPAEITLSGRALNPTERRVLDTYLEDAAEKLAVFEPLLERITLMLEIINDRFLYKSLRLDPSEGFVFESDRGERIGAEQLSSGEQHEMVLLYEFLFRTPPGALVLIDEPEISLHVQWQRKFIQDLQRISTLSDLRFIVATHSPQIVDKWFEKAILLGPGE